VSAFVHQLRPTPSRPPPVPPTKLHPDERHVHCALQCLSADPDANGRIIITTFPSPSSPHEIQPKAPSINDVSAQFRELYLKNTNTFLLTKETSATARKDESEVCDYARVYFKTFFRFFCRRGGGGNPNPHPPKKLKTRVLRGKVGPVSFCSLLVKG
jgi:hypothetical protein